FLKLDCRRVLLQGATGGSEEARPGRREAGGDPQPDLQRERQAAEHLIDAIS
uniref:Uncharacterized protein n=1 Tax=Aegilops tauschii subsp. strangulata TaxID=200361 RepID=A0A453D705_AEGTS